MHGARPAELHPQSYRSCDRSARNADDASEAPPINVLVLCPGGLEHGGGIGRQMGYFLAALPRGAETPEYRVSRHARAVVPRQRSLAHSAFRILSCGRGLPNRVGGDCRPTRSPACEHHWPRQHHAQVSAHGHRSRGCAAVRPAHPRLRLRRRRPRAGRVDAAPGARHVRRRGANHHPWGPRRSGPCAPRLRCRMRPSWSCRTRCPIRTPRRGRRPAVAAGPPHLVFLGHLSARKGVPELLEALASPALAALPWRATLAGGGPVDEFRARAAALGLADRVAFPGWIDQPAASALCAAADILVLPSHAEGLAMSVLEGLAHGLAVVATPVGAHAEVIEPEQSGLLVPPGDVAALARGAHPRDRRPSATRAPARRRPPALPRPLRRAVLCRAPGPAACRAARRSQPTGRD